jgi:hypothetical protein
VETQWAAVCAYNAARGYQNPGRDYSWVSKNGMFWTRKNAGGAGNQVRSAFVCVLPRSKSHDHELSRPEAASRSDGVCPVDEAAAWSGSKLAVKCPHMGRGVPLAGSGTAGKHSLDMLQIIASEFDVECPERFAEPVALPGTDERNNVRAAR